MAREINDRAHDPRSTRSIEQERLWFDHVRWANQHRGQRCHATLRVTVVMIGHYIGMDLMLLKWAKNSCGGVLTLINAAPWIVG